MKVNFFDQKCQTTINKKQFGLYDPEDNKIVKIIDFESDLCNATVINNNRLEILFTAIDNCIEIIRDNGELDNRCDAMMSYESNLLMIELKNKRDSWQSEGLNQIENTVKRLIEVNPEYFNSFKKRKAIVANRKFQSPNFQKSHNEQREYFMRKYRMRVQFEAEIVI